MLALIALRLISVLLIGRVLVLAAARPPALAHRRTLRTAEGGPIQHGRVALWAGLRRAWSQGQGLESFSG